MQVLERQKSSDGAIKYLLDLGGDSRVEAVFLKLEDNDKDSMCISSQIGCALTCRCCSTGGLGLKRNMTAEEIVAQVQMVMSDLSFTPTRRFDLSYMGMGEPLMNLDAVLASKVELARLYPYFTFYLSTVGLAPKIYELAERSPDISLQISLHAPIDELRSQILPVNKSYPIAQLLEAGEAYARASAKDVMLNYCLMRDVNDQPEHAARLAELVKDRPFRVQLVTFNPHDTIEYASSTHERSQTFLGILQRGGARAHYGRQLGREVGAGCGQLDADYAAGEFRGKAARRKLATLAIED